jgi:hypothetical protein
LGNITLNCHRPLTDLRGGSLDLGKRATHKYHLVSVGCESSRQRAAQSGACAGDDDDL